MSVEPVIFPLRVAMTNIEVGNFIYRYDTKTDHPTLTKLIGFNSLHTSNFGTLYLVTFDYRDVNKRGNLGKIQKDFGRRIITTTWGVKLPDFIIQPSWINDLEKIDLHDLFQRRLLKGDNLCDHVPNYMDV